MQFHMWAGAALLALLFATGGRAMENAQQQLAVAADRGRVLVTMTATNPGARAVPVPRAVYEDEELFAPAFDIVHIGSGAAIDYLGPKVKRGPVGPDDFLPLAPGATLRHTIDITDSYAFLPGSQRYRLRYPGQRFAMATQAGPAVDIEFRYTPP